MPPEKIVAPTDPVGSDLRRRKRHAESLTIFPASPNKPLTPYPSGNIFQPRFRSLHVSLQRRPKAFGA